MITKENIKDVVKQIKDSDKKRIEKSDKEFAVLKLHVFNVGSFVEVILTNDLHRYQNVSKDGNCIIELDALQMLLK